MSRIRLVPLQCPGCNHPLAAGVGEHLLATCDDCGTTCEVVGGVPLPRERTIYRPRSGSPTEFVPFWRFDTRVEIRRREAAGIGQLFKDLFRPGQDSGWVELRFFVPALEVSLGAFQLLSVKMIRRGAEALEPWEPAPTLPIHPTAMSMEEASSTLEFIILTIEAYQSDMLVDLDFSVDILASGVALIPATVTGKNVQLLV